MDSAILLEFEPQVNVLYSPASSVPVRGISFDEALDELSEVLDFQKTAKPWQLVATSVNLVFTTKDMVEFKKINLPSDRNDLAIHYGRRSVKTTRHMVDSCHGCNGSYHNSGWLLGIKGLDGDHLVGLATRTKEGFSQAQVTLTLELASLPQDRDQILSIVFSLLTRMHRELYMDCVNNPVQNAH